MTGPENAYPPAGEPQYREPVPYGQQAPYGAPVAPQGHPQQYPQPGFPQQGHPQGHPQAYPQGYPQPGYPPAGLRQGAYGPPLASYGQRVGSFLIDTGLPVVAYYVLVGLAAYIGDLTVALVIYGVAFLGLLGFVIWNSGYRQGTTGQSLGRKVLGTRLVGQATGQPVGFGLAVGRQFAHILDSLPFYLGYLWPLWDEQRQTFADKVCSTLVVRADA